MDSTQQPAVPAPAPFGEVYDRGYQHYEGPRLGRPQAIWALSRYSMLRALGVRKPWTAKVIPALVYLGVAIVVIIPVGILAFLPGATVLEYWDFVSFIFLLEAVFVAAIAPEMLCPDRREKVLSLYFSRGITRFDYLLGKLVATAILTLTVSLLPLVIYWLLRQLLADHPLQAMADNIGDLGRVTLVGVTVALYLGAIGLAVASFTARKGVAVAVTIIGFLASTSLAFILSQAVEDERISRALVFLSPSSSLRWFSYAVFDQPLPELAADVDQRIFGPPYPVPVQLAVFAGIILFCLLLMAWRYRPND